MVSRARFAAVMAALVLLLVSAGAPNVSGFAPADQAFSYPANAKAANLNVTLKNLDDKPVKLSDYKGKVLLIDLLY